MKRDQYIPHDASARNNSKLMHLMEETGPAGYGIYWGLMEYLRTQTDYTGSMKLIKELARQLHTSPGKVKKVLLEYELFTVEGDTFYSSGLNTRMQRLDKTRTLFDAYQRKKTEAKLLEINGGTDTVKNYKPKPKQTPIPKPTSTTFTEVNAGEEKETEAAEAEAGIGSETKAGIKAGAETSAGTSERISVGTKASAGTSAETKTSAAELELVLHPGAALWEKWVDELDCEAQWKELVAKRSGMMMDFFPLFPRLLECFKNHVRSIGNEDKIRCLNDAKRYFSFYLSPGSITRKRLAEELKAGSRTRDRGTFLLRLSHPRRRSAATHRKGPMEPGRRLAMTVINYRKPCGQGNGLPLRVDKPMNSD